MLLICLLVFGCTTSEKINKDGYLELAGKDSLGWTFSYMFEPESLKDSMEFYQSPFPIVKRLTPEGYWITLIYTFDERWIVLDKQGKLHVRAYSNPEYEQVRNEDQAR